MGLAFTIYRAAHDRQVKALQRQLDELRQENEALKVEGAEGVRPLVEDLQGRLAKADETEQSLRLDLQTAEDQRLSQLAAK